MSTTRYFDLLILGGGIAGMTAAIFAARANLRTAIIEEKVCGGLANSTNVIENFPSHQSINGMELMESVLTQVEKLEVTVDQAAEVQRLDITGFPKVVETSEAIYSSKAIILATGRQPIALRLDNDCDRIHYCSVCDGSAYAGKKVLVVGGGNSGFDESLYLLSLGVRQIIMVEALEKCCASEVTQDKLRQFENVSIMTSTAVRGIAEENGASRVMLEDLVSGEFKEADVDGVFVFIGQKPSTETFNDVVKLDEDGYILTGKDRETNLLGVYAAGDVVQKKYRYLTTAMADATIAALAAAEFIRAEE